ncbi:hypothetical protein TMM008_01850 [Pseudomonas sp. 008]|nr:hypothetical protein TMM008_01850 [Pseudomonas sp. 008]
MPRGAAFFAGMTKAQLRACIRLRLKERELEEVFHLEFRWIPILKMLESVEITDQILRLG